MNIGVIAAGARVRSHRSRARHAQVSRNRREEERRTYENRLRSKSEAEEARIEEQKKLETARRELEYRLIQSENSKNDQIAYGAGFDKDPWKEYFENVRSIWYGSDKFMEGENNLLP